MPAKAAPAAQHTVGHPTPTRSQCQTAAGPEPVAKLLAFQRSAGNRAFGGWIQAKLNVSQPGDDDEREADRVAGEVMRMPADPGAPVRIAMSSPPVANLKRCACTEGAGDEHLQRNGAPAQGGTSTPSVDSATESRIGAIRGTGQPLGTEDRSFFEPRLGLDLSHVRVHTGGEATAVATNLQARAFTVGRDIVFGSGQFAPTTPSGRSLLAHELAHVVQQRGEPGSAARVQRECSTLNIAFAAARGNYGALAGEGWLCLDEADKTKYIDVALKGAAVALNKIPDDPALGILWPMFRAGLIGFVQRLQQPAVKPEEKIKAMDKLAGIVAGKSMSFNLAYLKGLAKGFFIDGALGLFILMYDLLKLVPAVWRLFEQVEEAIEGFPEEIVVLVDEFKTLYAALVAAGPGALEDIKQWASDPKRVLDALSGASAELKGLLNEKGGDLAEGLVKAVNKPGSEKVLGETTGAISGQILWEVAFAALTAGGGTAVTAAKETMNAGIAVLKKLVGKVVGSLLKVFAELKTVLEPVAGWVRKAAKAIKGKMAELGERFAGLIERVRNFLAKLLSNCHETTLVCATLGKGKKKKPKSKGKKPEISAGEASGLHEEGQLIMDEKELLGQTGVREQKPLGQLQHEAKQGNRFEKRLRRKGRKGQVPIYDKAGRRNRLDFYDEAAGEIISVKSLASKRGQIVMVDEFEMLKHFQEFPLKYPVNAKLVEGPLAGQVLKGRYVLEVPPQVYPVPERILELAKKSQVLIRDLTGKTYN